MELLAGHVESARVCVCMNWYEADQKENVYIQCDMFSFFLSQGTGNEA